MHIPKHLEDEFHSDESKKYRDFIAMKLKSIENSLHSRQDTISLYQASEK